MLSSLCCKHSKLFRLHFLNLHLSPAYFLYTLIQYIFSLLWFEIVPLFFHLNVTNILHVSFISLSQSYDKCFLGSSETADANRVFCGQLGAIYVFSEALNPAQIFAIHQLGPSYKVCKKDLQNPVIKKTSASRSGLLPFNIVLPFLTYLLNPLLPPLIVVSLFLLLLLANFFFPLPHMMLVVTGADLFSLFELMGQVLGWE